MSAPLAITGASVVTPDGLLADNVVIVEGGRVVRIAADARPPAGARTVDARGLLVSPGLIDLQLNGGFGHDFSVEPQAMWQVGDRITAHGVTAYLPTIVSSPMHAVTAAQAALAAGSPDGWRGAIPLGLHLEGPFLSPSAAGAHDTAQLRAPDPAWAAEWSPHGGVRMITLAPELEGALGLVERLAAAGVVVSAGHSAATYEQGVAAIDAGVRYATHVLNAMPALDKRAPGLAAALIEEPRVTLGLIPDGIHVHPAVMRIVERAAGRARISIVTDATAGLGMPPGGYQLAGARVVLDGPSVRLPDGTLAGSALSADEAVRRLARLTGRTPADALAAMTSVPARVLGDSSRGSLVPGARADLAVWTPDLEVVATFVGGEEVYAQWP